MSVITTTDLQRFLGLPARADLPANAQTSLDATEAVVAAYLGTDTIKSTVRAEKVRAPRDRLTIEIALGPIQTFTSVTFNDGANTVADTSAGKWAVEADTGFSHNIVYTVNYTSGWSPTNIPDVVKQAILVAAESHLDGAGRGVASESVGDFSRSMHVIEGTHPLPPLSRTLLQQWRRPIGWL